ncbi:MAG: hypothetical protein AB8B48_12335 [Pseudomonadales bacterium]
MISVRKTAIVTIMAFTITLVFSKSVHPNSGSEAFENTSLLGATTAPTLDQFLRGDSLRVKSWLQPKSNIVVGQQIELNIEVASSSWFSGGTRIGRFELDDAIVLRRNKFAVNSSRREAGNTWSIQLWTITIYPQRSGAFNIPAIDIHVSVADPENPVDAITGVVQTEALSFVSTLPEVIPGESIKYWIASNDFTISDEFDKPINADTEADAINAGDALRRTITLRAENVAAMMLPTIDVVSVPGLAAYSRPARLEDRVNRGSYLAVRRDVISYVAEKEGVYTLPEIVLHWWNTQTLTLEQLVLPAHELRVGRATDAATLLEKNSAARQMAYGLVSILAIVLLIFLCLKNKRIRTIWHASKQLLYPESRRKKRELIRSYRNSEPTEHVFRTLKWLDSRGLGSQQSIRTYLSAHHNPKLSALYEQMMQHAFGSNTSRLSTEDFGYFVDEIDRTLDGSAYAESRAEIYLNPRHH